MAVLPKESRIVLAIEAIHTTKKMSIQGAAKAYNVPESSIRDRIKGIPPLTERRNSRHQLTPTKEETLIQYILNQDTQGFPPQISSVEDIANSLLATHCIKPVSKL